MPSPAGSLRWLHLSPVQNLSYVRVSLRQRRPSYGLSPLQIPARFCRQRRHLTGQGLGLLPLPLPRLGFPPKLPPRVRRASVEIRVYDLPPTWHLPYPPTTVSRVA